MKAAHKKWKSSFNALLTIFILMLNFSESFATTTSLNDKFFVGGDGQINMYKSNEVFGASIFGGYRFCHDLGLELGFSKFIGGHWGSNVSLNSQNVYLDLQAFHCLSECLELKGIVGIGLFNANPKGFHHFSESLAANKVKKTATGFRAGIGVQYIYSDKITGDFMYKFQTKCSTYIGFLGIISLGLRYYF